MIEHGYILNAIRAYNEASGKPFRACGMAADFAQLEATNQIVAPACYVVPGGNDSFSDTSDFRRIRQAHRASVGIVMIARNYRSGAVDAIGDLNSMRHHVRNVMLGMMVPGATMSMRHVRGISLRYTQELTVYVDEFQTEFAISKDMTQ